MVLKRRADEPCPRVDVAEFDLRPIAQLGDDGIDVAAAFLERFQVVDQEGQLIPRDAAGKIGRVRQRQNVCAERGNLIIDAFLCASASGQHRNHGRNADDDSEHRQYAAK